MTVDPLLLVFVCAILFAVFWRFWHARDLQRQQMKWFAMGTVILIVAVGINAVGFPQSNLGFAIGFGVLPFSVAIAVLRARLYDIDVIINRALVYGLLTAALAAIYFGAVLGAQVVATRRMSGLTPIQNQPIVIVLSTLLIAALFQPLRSRIQGWIDRRFYRHKYDGARMVAKFSSTLRTEVEMQRLCDRLVDVVDETMQPAHVSLWLAARPLGASAAQRSDTAPHA